MSVRRRANLVIGFVAVLICVVAFGVYRFTKYGELILPDKGGVSADTKRPVDYPSGMVKKGPETP